MRSILTKYQALGPKNGQPRGLLWSGIFCAGSAWATVAGSPSWGSNQYDDIIEDFDNIIEAAVTDFGYAFAKQRDDLIAYLGLYNVPEPGQPTGFVTAATDAIHLNTLGQRLWCRTVNAKIQAAA